MIPGVKYEGITDAGLTFTDKDNKKQTLKADTYIVALPMLSNPDIVKQFSNLVKNTIVIGNCATPGLIVDAIYDGARTGYHLL